MAFFIGREREARRAYGFDEIALVPGALTINPAEVDISTKIGDIDVPIPFIASAMDGVVDVKFAITMGKLGGIAVLNLDGVQTRYEDPYEILGEIQNATPEKATELVQKMYKEPIKEKLISKRVEEMKKAGIHPAVSSIPQNAEKFGPLAQEAGASFFFVQATVITVRHQATTYKTVDLHKYCKKTMKIPVVLGNTVQYDATLELLDTGCAAILVGVGPGSACTSRGVLGIGVPQVTATVDCAAARDFYFKQSGRYVPIITDGGMSTGGDICKSFACGADAVMVGSAFARAKEAPGGGYHWGMATPHHNLPRGTRIHVGTTGSLDEILFGPAKTDDGTQNLVGALRTCMGSVGATTIRTLQLTEIVLAPEIKNEGKLFQKAQKLGMGK
jgi:IMP dehydrogenase